MQTYLHYPFFYFIDPMILNFFNDDKNVNNPLEFISYF